MPSSSFSALLLNNPIQLAPAIFRTYNLLREKNIDSAEKLDEITASVKTEMKEAHKQIRKIDGKIATANETIKYLDRTHSNKKIWDNYIRSGRFSSFCESHRADLMIYESAVAFLKRNNVSPDADPDTYRDQAADLEKQRTILYTDLQGLQKERKELDMIKQNVDIIMNDTKEKQREKRKVRE